MSITTITRCPSRRTMMTALIDRTFVSLFDLVELFPVQPLLCGGDGRCLLKGREDPVVGDQECPTSTLQLCGPECQPLEVGVGVPDVDHGIHQECVTHRYRPL